MATVLVTGGSGFIGAYCVLDLLRQGHRVRTTVRSLAREHDVREMLRQGGINAEDRLTVVAANLETDEGWPDAVAGCEYVLHVASPTLTSLPRTDDEMIAPARDGVLRVLRAARDAKVRRVVLTSASGAIAYGHPPRSQPFDETDWTDLNNDVPAYQKSKTLAERAAWHFIQTEGGDLELAVINPVAVLGPVLGPDYSPSLNLVRRMLDGGMPFCPHFSVGFVDVRDVADLHVRAMTDPRARGERFIAASGRAISILELAQMLRRQLGAVAARVPKREMPSALMRIIALWNPGVRAIVPQLDKAFDLSGDKARKVLDWAPRSVSQSLEDTARSLLALSRG
jgi:dihydroflavonol-4-reductase